MAPHCLGKPTDPGQTAGDNRRFAEGVPEWDRQPLA